MCSVRGDGLDLLAPLLVELLVYQSLKLPTVDILNAMDSVRSHICHAATVVGNGPLDAELFAGDRAVQFHGGMGFTDECDAQLFIRRGQWMRQLFGDPAQHRRQLAGLLLHGAA